MIKNNWYVITGGPSTGKTTLLAELGRRGYATIPEAARSVIDENLASGISVEQLRRDEKKFQEEVVRRKAAIEASLDPQTITFFDRGMQDTLAYLMAYDFTVEPWVETLVRGAAYQKIFLLEPVGTFEADYARTEDAAFTKQLHSLLHDAYSQYKIEVIAVPPMSVKERADYVLQSTNRRSSRT